MRSVKIKDVLNAIRVFNMPLFQKESNNAIRTWITKKLSNGNLYFIYRDRKIHGLVEWYRYTSMNELIWDFKTGKLVSTNGPILYINNFGSYNNSITRTEFNIFFNTLQKSEKIQHYFRLMYKKNKYLIKEIQFRR